MPLLSRNVSADPPGPAAWLTLCRPGFEAEAVQELAAFAQAVGSDGFGRARANTGLAEFVVTDGTSPDPPPLTQLIFARQAALAFADCRDLPLTDRATPIRDRLAATGRRWSELLVEAPDSDAGRELAPLCRGLGGALRGMLDEAGLLTAGARRRLHVIVLATDAVLLAESDPAVSSPWPGGIPRLRRLPGAPSRSAAKLDEALATMLDDGERERLLKPGMTAVDLGAAPGGWSWVLAGRHLRVTAVDNGPLQPQVLDTGLVDHVRADGFSWRPPKPVDWLVCDMVEQPSRVAVLIGRWLADGACRRALFNLKLPMKKRYAETLRCLELLRDTAGRSLDVRCRQLYHDREEVTVLAL